MYSPKSKIEKIRLAYSTKKEGNMSFRYGSIDEVKNNRNVFLQKANIEPKDCVYMKVQDSDGISVVGREQCGAGMESLDSSILADALITRTRGIYLLLTIADCLPVVIVDPKKEILALAHCGWKSVDCLLPSTVIKKITSMYSSNPQDIHIVIGPSIKKDSYYIHSQRMMSAHMQPFVTQSKDGGCFIDLVGSVVSQCMRYGVPKGNIDVDPIDTAIDTRFFSHYRDSRNGLPEQRFMCSVGME